jgi:hypothetical protein
MSAMISRAKQLGRLVRFPLLLGFLPRPSALTPHPFSTVHFAFSVVRGPFLRHRKTRKIDRRLKNAVIERGSTGLQVAGKS